MYRNKLECLSLTLTFNLAQYLQDRLEPTQEEHLIELFVLVTSIRLERKWPKATNALAYYEAK